ncbi:MAG: hypothetical protein Q9166_006045 [cf. Caloplaca sp. 2 TL-2023]
MAYPPPPGGQPTSFKTNVNRAKTKRWVEAKSYSYDGDDWGDMDEYDEYGGYDEPPPPSRPTGLRQRGQSVSRDQQGMPSSQQVGYGNPQASQHGYGNLGRQPPIQQQYGARSATNPPYQQSQLERSGSFDRGDERRAFSAAVPHQQPPPLSGMYQEVSYAQGPVSPISNYPSESSSQPGPPLPNNYPDMQDRDFQDRNFSPPMDSTSFPYSDQPRQTSMGSRTQSMTSNISSNDFHNRRDFSPSAVPPPLSTRGSPSPHRTSDSQSAWRPPRKSSLSQQNHLDQAYERQDHISTAELETEERETAPRDRARSDISKPLPFVRPADIYRRMQEEKERERQSQDSSRPSMDAIMADDRSRIDPRSDSSGTSEHIQEVESRQAPRSSLDPVAERKSEYGMSGISLNQTEPREASAGQPTPVAEPAKRAEPSGIKSSLSPQLPDVARMSGFGELFANTLRKTDDAPDAAAPQQNNPSHFVPDQSLHNQSDSPLQHQPSLGFRSVVHQAFDTSHEPIPETPSSSTADSSIGRSGSGGTSAVSPIISRGPSSATTNLNFRDPQIRPATPPAVGQSADNIDRPLSSGSLSTPKAVPRKPSPDSNDQRPARFIPGHRRDLSTPSPDNSPARTPALEANKQLQQPQEAELATTTPIETSFPDVYGQHADPSSGRTSPIKSPAQEMPKSPTESTRSRVRNLAERFESGRSSPAASERAPSPVKPSFAPSQVFNHPRPLPADRLESFRPKLPGGWESSASLAPLTAPSKHEATTTSIPLEQRLQNTSPGPSDLRPSPSQITGTQAETQRQEGQEKLPSSDPFTRLAAAGSALAGAFSTAVGHDKDEDDRRPPAGPPAGTGRNPGSSIEKEGLEMTTSRKAATNTDYIPEASKPMMVATPDDGTSSIMPTPLDKVSQPTHSGENKAADYFAAGAKQQPQTSVDSYTTQDSASTKRSHLLPSLSTDTLPQYESDRLRREIIKELSPRLTSEPSTAESNSPLRDDSRLASNPSLTRQQQHESLILPREYDSYWNGSSSEQSSRASSVKGSSKAVRDTMQGYDQSQNPVPPANDITNISQTLGGGAHQTQDPVPERPDLPAHRFSWETPSNNITPQPPLQSPSMPPSQESRAHEEDVDGLMGQPLMQHETLANQQTSGGTALAQEPIGLGAPLEHRAHEHSRQPQAAEETEGLAHPIGIESNETSGKLDHTDRLEAAMNDAEPSITNSGPLQDKNLQTDGGKSNDQSRCPSTANDLPSPPALPSAPPKIRSFREILALKEPQDRIKGYNETREQFANMDTGLTHWLAITTTGLAEHKEILPNGRLLGVAGAKPVASRTKLGGLLPSGSSSTQQSSYHSPSGASEGTQVPYGISNQGFSPSSGSVKLSSQQMQARGKDLLHTAGLFGGKANVAAKGLFSKGKSKLKGGNADKAPISSFNIKETRRTPPTQQSFQSFPSTPKSDVFLAQSPSSRQFISSRPRSYVAQSEHQTSAELFPDQGPSQLPSLPQEYQQSGSLPIDKSSSTSNEPELPVQVQQTDPIPNRDVANNGPVAETTRAAAPDDINLSRTQSVPGHDNDHVRRTQNPETPTNTNRTPTQADYADYFRRGSSPTAIILQGQHIGRNQQTSDGEASTQRRLTEPREAQRDPLPTLQSRYSTKTPRDVASADAKPTSPYRDQPLLDQENLQRGSEDSDGTFHTAGSVVGADPRKTATGSPQSVPDPEQTQSAESSVNRSSSGGSSSITPPVAKPAANIQDQPKSRPFSFIQFSQNSEPKPLEHYSHRRPSVDSLPGRIDPERDVPPPISPQQSMIHEENDQSGRKSPIHHGVDHDFVSNNGRPMSTSPRSFSRPFQESNLQDPPAFRREESPVRGEDLPAQHYPAPISRQDVPNPIQQATEYSLEGIGPPPAPQPEPRPTESRSSSKRESRSSAFFRSFRSPADPASPPLAGERCAQDEIDSQGDPRIRKTKSKRGSLFRSLTGGSKSNRSEEVSPNQQNPTKSIHAKSSEMPVAQGNSIHSAKTQDHTQTANNDVERNVPPAKAPSKYRNRLSRTAASKEGVQQQSQEPGKKKRFSAIGNLFGRSKDNKLAGPQPDSSRPGADQVISEEPKQSRDRSSRLSSSNKLTRGHAPPSESTTSRDVPYQYTRDSLAKEGLLPSKPRQSSSRSPEPSAYHETSTQQQQMFPPRHQSLSQGPQREEQRSFGWPRQSSSTSSNNRHQQPPSAQRLQSTITTRSTTRHLGGLPPPDTKPRQLSSFTTTTTTTTSGGKTSTSTRQESLGNNLPRSDSPPPPPPPPKDTWHQPRTHQRSTSSISVVRNSTDRPMQAPNINNNNSNYSRGLVQSTPVTSPPSSQAFNNDRYFHNPIQSTNIAPSPPVQPQNARSPSIPTHQSLPPLQTNIPASSPAGPRPYSPNPSTSFDPEARKARRSQIESMGTPRAESATVPFQPGDSINSDPEARKLRRSQIESMRTPKAEQMQATSSGVSVGGGGSNAASDPENRKLRRSQIERGTPRHEHPQPNSADAPEVAGDGANAGDGSKAGREMSKRRKSEDEDEPIVMSATSFPGQEWQPNYGYGGWEGD